MSNPVSMVMEYLKLGPLDAYLLQNHANVKQADLVEASTCLATALWHMVSGNHFLKFIVIPIITNSIGLTFTSYHLFP
jgi:uncharacterized membrane protein